MKILSLGAGVQSTVLALLAQHGLLEKPDAAIFADTGWEPKTIYNHLDWLESVLDFPVYRVSAGNIRDDITQGVTAGRYASMPFFLSNGGMGRRQCTNEYKIQPIIRKVRELVGLKKGERAGKSLAVEQWIGISLDEMQRMKMSQKKWITHRWPLIELRMNRTDCIAWFNKNYPGRELSKSSCIACPYHSNDEYRNLNPEEFEEACVFDEKVRFAREMNNQQFIHSDRVPLREVDLSTPADHGQLSFMDECDGMCGV
jgi:hypothetical protein